MAERLCVLGMGYVGLPTASMFAISGHDVLGVDTDPKVASSLRAGDMHIAEPELRTFVEAALQSGRLHIAAVPEQADVFIVAVPTPLGNDRRADLTSVVAAGRSIAQVLQPGNMVVLESTVPPRTTQDVLVPVLERSGLKATFDFDVVHCPERVLPGSILVELVQNDRVIGGLTPKAARRAAELYAGFAKGQIHLTDCTTAEFVKLMENTHRDVNIALANELAVVAERIGVNVWGAIDLANRHPRVNVLRPGPGVGGHCIAVDPWFIAQAAPGATSLIQAARAVNDGMASHVVETIASTVSPEEGHLALLGAAYKANSDDIRLSPALSVLELAVERGYRVRLFDPRLRASAAPSTAQLARTLAEAVSSAAGVIVLTDHDEFRSLDPALISSKVKRRLVFDTRNCLDKALWEQQGFTVITLGDSAPVVGGSRRLNEVATLGSSRSLDANV